MKTILELRDINAGYGSVQVLFDVSLRVIAGEAMAVLGPNGAGKTTLLRTASAFLQPMSGSIHFRDEDVTRYRPHEVVEAGVAQVLQGRHIIAPMTVADNLLLGAHHRYRRSKRREIDESLEYVYELFPVLRDRSGLPAGALSGGEQQMLAIGRALMSRPELLLLDEPSMGLAPLIVEEILDTLRHLKEDGLTLVLIEQNPDLVANIADRVCVLETGRVVEVGDVELARDRERMALMYLGGDTSTWTSD